MRIDAVPPPAADFQYTPGTPSTSDDPSSVEATTQVGREHVCLGYTG